MTQAHVMKTGISTSNSFSVNYHPQAPNLRVPEISKVPPLIRPFLPQIHSPASVLERRSYSSSLTLRQQQMDLIDQSFSKNAESGLSLILVLGAGSLIKNLKWASV